MELAFELFIFVSLALIVYMFASQSSDYCKLIDKFFALKMKRLNDIHAVESKALKDLEKISRHLSHLDEPYKSEAYLEVVEITKSYYIK